MLSSLVVEPLVALTAIVRLDGSHRVVVVAARRAGTIPTTTASATCSCVGGGRGFGARLGVRCALFSFLGWLVAGVCLVEWFLGEDAVEGGDPARLLDGFEALHFGFVLVEDHHRVDLVELVEVADAALDELNEDEGLDDGVAGGSDGH